MWRFLMFALFSGIMLSVANIVRREWITVEKVPFPYTQVYHSCLVNVEGMGIISKYPLAAWWVRASAGVDRQAPGAGDGLAGTAGDPGQFPHVTDHGSGAERVNLDNRQRERRQAHW
jgi:hypothetical protein